MNYEQLALKRRLEMCINRNDTGFFGVFGPGGTGKTYTVTRILGVDKFLFLAPTNKAANEVNKNLTNSGIKNKCITIDRYLGYSKEKDEYNKDLIKYTPIEKLEIPKVIVIDEVSMMNDEHVRMFAEISKKAFIILMGDVMQIPPVRPNDKKTYNKEGFEVSKIFNEIHDFFNLTVQNRQDPNSRLFKMINHFRSIMNEKINFQQFALKYINSNDIINFDIHSDKLNEYILNHRPICVSYTNLTSNFFNYKISKVLNPHEKTNQITVGSTYYFKKSCITKEKVFYTSELVTVYKIKLVKKDIIIPVFNKKLEFEYNEIDVLFLTDKTIHKIYLPNEDARQKIYSFINYRIKNYPLTNDEKAKIFTWYEKYKNSFACLSMTHAMTAHKSQGSTFENVLVPIYDFADYNGDYKYFNQLFYTAISRAKEKIIFVTGLSNFNDTSKRPPQWTHEEKKYILEEIDYKCFSCQKIFEHHRDFEIHHIIPLNAGGNNQPENLRPLCKECHKLIHKNETT